MKFPGVPGRAAKHTSALDLTSLRVLVFVEQLYGYRTWESNRNMMAGIGEARGGRSTVWSECKRSLATLRVCKIFHAFSAGPPPQG